MVASGLSNDILERRRWPSGQAHRNQILRRRPRRCNLPIQVGDLVRRGRSESQMEGDLCHDDIVLVAHIET